MKQGDKVIRKDKNLEPQGMRLSSEVITVLKECNFKGEVTQIQDGLIYVAFRTKNAWITQVFKPEELEVL